MLKKINYQHILHSLSICWMCCICTYKYASNRHKIGKGKITLMIEKSVKLWRNFILGIINLQEQICIFMNIRDNYILHGKYGKNIWPHFH